MKRWLLALLISGLFPLSLSLSLWCLPLPPSPPLPPTGIVSALLVLSFGSTMLKFLVPSPSSSAFIVDQCPSLPEGLTTKLHLMTGGRAPLLAELPDRALRRLDAEFPQTLSSLTTLRRTSSTVHGIDPCPRRFLPVSVFAAGSSSPASFAEFARLARPPHWTWTEVAAARGPITPAGLGVLMDSLFKEEAHMAALRRAGTSHCSFEDRLAHSDCSHLLPAYNLEDHAHGSALWSEKPRKRLRSLKAELDSKSDLSFIDPIKWRFPSHLSLEVGLRYEVRSVLKSWKSYRSGLSAWGSFMDDIHPLRDPFDLTEDCVFGFSALFNVPGTFKEYLGHTKFGLRLLGREMAMPQATLQQLLRGMSKCRPRREMPRLRNPEVRRLVARCLSIGRVALARFFILARNLLARVMDELLPLQLDGRSGLPEDSTAWHSQIIFSYPEVTVVLRTRKNAPNGARIVRRCSCGEARDPFCTYCVLREHTRHITDPRQRVWPFSQSQATSWFKALCSAMGLQNPGWHSFRRGMATDYLSAGKPLSFILRAGGWKSSAVLLYLAQSELDRRESLEYTLADSDSDHDSPGRM